MLSDIASLRSRSEHSVEVLDQWREVLGSIQRGDILNAAITGGGGVP
jgi:hypothetical protein